MMYSLDLFGSISVQSISDSIMRELRNRHSACFIKGRSERINASSGVTVLVSVEFWVRNEETCGGERELKAGPRGDGSMERKEEGRDENKKNKQKKRD